MGSKVCSDQDLADVMEIITQPLLIKKECVHHSSFGKIRFILDTKKSHTD